MNAEQSINQRELRLQSVGGKSETEFVVNQSLSLTAGKTELATELAEERLRPRILQPIVYSWTWRNINHHCTLTVVQARPTMLCISLVHKLHE